MPTLQQVVARLDKELKTDTIVDQSLNGLQVEAVGRVGRVALAVDATRDTIQAAAEKKANLLIVHHGLFWGQASCLRGPLYHKVRHLLENNIGLYASHLPLDLHPKLGNNILLAKTLNLKQTKPFGNYHGITIGIGGKLDRPVSQDRLGEHLSKITGGNHRVFGFGKKEINKVAIISGGGGDMVTEAACFGYDAYITGEIAHQVYHIAKENKITVITGGHYATETLGVRELGRFLERIFQIKCFFLDFPTGL